jgi:hypothetical protein
MTDYIMPGWQSTHIASGELRDIRTASKLKTMGLKRGWPDLILISPAGIFHGLELKRAGETLTPDQEAFQLWAIRYSIPYCVAHSIDEALRALDHWGALRIKINSQFPETNNLVKPAASQARETADHGHVADPTSNMKA